MTLSSFARRARRTAVVAALLLPMLAGAQALDATASCDRVKDPGALAFDGRTLREAPDLGSDALRDINLTMNVRGCRGDAEQRLAAYRAAHPDDFTADFVEARLLWGQGDIDGARQLLTATLAAHPTFASAHVLIGSMALAQGDVDTARASFDRASTLSPDDLWMTVHRYEIHAMLDPSERNVAQLVKVVQAAAIPPFARESAAVAALNLPTLSLAQREAIYRAQMTFDSATPLSMKQGNLGRFLIEDGKQYAAGRAALAPLLGTAYDDQARVLTAESYLLEAAAIDGMPSARNAALVAKAKESLHGDLSPLAPRIAMWPRLKQLQPFLGTGIANPDATDENGHTALCNAAIFLNPEAVAAALALGAETEAPCEDTTPLGYVIMSASQDWDLKRTILTQLLDRGANPDPELGGGHYTALSFCVPSEAICGKELRPLLERYVKDKAK